MNHNMTDRPFHDDYVCLLVCFRAWKTGIKISWNIPRTTHSYFVQEVLTTGVQSLEQRIFRNTAGFFQSLIDCPSPEVAVLARISARDIRSSLGKNLQRICELTQLDPWSATKTELHAALERGLHIETPKADTWRPRCLANLLAEKVKPSSVQTTMKWFV